MPTIALITGAALVGATVFTALSPRTYESSTSVLVAPVSTGADVDIENGRTKGTINLDTEAQIVRSVALADEVADMLDSDLSPRKLAESVSVTVPANSQVLDITFEGPTADEAMAGAKTYAEAYLDQRRTSTEDSLADARSDILDQIDELQTEFADATARSRDSKLSKADRTIASTRRDLLLSQISSLNASLTSISGSRVDPGHVLSTANYPDSPASPSFPINLSAGLLLGLLISFAFAVVSGRFDHRIRTPRDIRPPTGAVRVHQELLNLSEGIAEDLPADNVDQLRVAIDSFGSNEPRAVLVAPVGAHRDADTLALALGHSYARRLGSATCAIASTAESNETEAIGLTDLFAGDGAVKPVALDDSGLAVIGPGRNPERLGVMLQRPHAIERVLRLSDTVVVLSTPSLHLSAGAQSVLHAVDRIVLVGVAGSMDDRALAQTIEAVERSHFTGTTTVVLLSAGDELRDRRKRRLAGSVPSDEVEARAVDEAPETESEAGTDHRPERLRSDSASKGGRPRPTTNEEASGSA
ncbi:MAG: hypothetical protein QM611_06790 [Microbacterium sp.]